MEIRMQEVFRMQYRVLIPKEGGKGSKMGQKKLSWDATSTKASADPVRALKLG